MLAIKAVVKNGLIKPLEAIALPEDKEIVIYILEEKAEEEYSDWTEEEWQRFILPVKERDTSFSYQMMIHQEETGFAKKVLGNEKEDVWNDIYN